MSFLYSYVPYVVVTALLIFGSWRQTMIEQNGVYHEAAKASKKMPVYFLLVSISLWIMAAQLFTPGQWEINIIVRLGLMLMLSIALIVPVIWYDFLVESLKDKKKSSNLFLNAASVFVFCAVPTLWSYAIFDQFHVPLEGGIAGCVSLYCASYFLYLARSKFKLEKQLAAKPS